MRREDPVRKLLAIFVLGSVGFAQAQAVPGFQFQFAETPGPYGAGLKVVERHDLSRTAQAPKSPSQNGRDTTNGRSLQVLVWYPAQKFGKPTMSLADYQSLVKAGLSSHEGQASRLSFIESYMRGTLALHTWAVKEAAPDTGHFPVVIYAPSLNAPSIENIELCEYLATEGFIVLGSSSIGADSGSMTIDLAGANAQAADVSYLIDIASSLPDADLSRVATVGYSWGAMGALFAASRDQRIKALVSLDGSFRYSPGMVQSSGDVHPEQMKIPLLVFSRAEETLEAWDAMRKDKSSCDCAPNVLNQWTHGDLIHVQMLAMSHIQFSSLYQRSERFRNEALKFAPADYSLDEGSASYNWVALYTMEFLKCYLENESVAKQFLARTPTENGVPRHLISIIARHQDVHEK